MTLYNGRIHTSYTIKKLLLPMQLCRRLEALGMVPGTKIMMLGKKGRGAIIIKLRGTKFAVGKTIAESIMVEV